MDDYSFHSTLAASLIPAWIADAAEFDRQRAKQLLDRYRAVRHLLAGAWYPLQPYSRHPREWLAMQFHRADLGDGMILVFRHAESPYRTIEFPLRALNPNPTYVLTFDSSPEQRWGRGAELMKGFLLSLSKRPASDLILYRQVEE